MERMAMTVSMMASSITCIPLKPYRIKGYHQQIAEDTRIPL
jgi:hypothetical protein